MDRSFDRIPIVDTRTTHDIFARKFGEALLHTGFVCVTHAQIDPAVVQAAYGAARKVFDLPHGTKMKYHRPEIGGALGYTPLGEEHARDQKVGDIKQFWHSKRFNRPNVWPVEVPEYAPAASALFTELERCGVWLLNALDTFFRQLVGTFARMTTDGETLLRLLWYPPLVGGEEGMRSAPHEDINLITLLPASTGPGLEVLNREGAWVPIDAPPGALVVNVGDMLQEWTRSFRPDLVMPSTTHQVVNVIGDGGRMSAPCFIHPRGEVVLNKDTGLTAGAYLKQRLREIGLIKDQPAPAPAP